MRLDELGYSGSVIHKAQIEDAKEAFKSHRQNVNRFDFKVEEGKAAAGGGSFFQFRKIKVRNLDTGIEREYGASAWAHLLSEDLASGVFKG